MFCLLAFFEPISTNEGLSEVPNAMGRYPIMQMVSGDGWDLNEGGSFCPKDIKYQ